MPGFTDEDLRRIAADLKKYAKIGTKGARAALSAMTSMLPKSKEREKVLAGIKKGVKTEKLVELTDDLVKTIK